MDTRIDTLSDELQYGTRLDNYIIQSVLGRGAFGITYLAIDNLDRKVAIKEYLPSGFSKRDKRHTVSPLTQDNQALFKYGLDCFLDEAKTVGKFNHPNIVRVLAFFEANQTAYMVMEYEEGQDLKAYLKHYPKLSEHRLLEIFCPINDGLIKVHKHGYIHRDIKPANIYIRKDNSPVLIDFGAARDVFNAKIDQLTRIMTPGYAPYEQDNPSWADQGSWTDIYALGATLYFAMKNTRIVAAQERASAIMLKTADPYHSIALQLQDHYSPHFLAAIDHALAFHPDQRPQNVSDWNSELLGSVRSDEDKTAILLTGQFSNRLEDTRHIATVTQPLASNTETSAQSNVETPVTTSSAVPIKKDVETPRTVKRSIPINGTSAATHEAIPIANWLFKRWILSLFLISIVVSLSYLYMIKDDQKTSLQISSAINNDSNKTVAPKPKPPIETVKQAAPYDGDSTKILVPKPNPSIETVQQPPLRVNNELIDSKIEIALAHIISASEFYMRANIKEKAIADFEKNNIKISSKMLTTLQLQQSDFMNKFKYHFDIYLKNLLQLRGYETKEVQSAITKIISNGEHKNKAIHIDLSEFFIANINKNNIEPDTLEKKLKDTLHSKVQ